MNRQAAKICIVTPGHLCTTPRVVKEATALAGAGFDVRVVFAQERSTQQRHFDDAILASNVWRSTVVRAGVGSKEERRRLVAVMRQRAFASLPARIWPLGKIAEATEGRYYPQLAAAAVSERADLYIGHYPVGLAAAARAASHWRARLGFDAEDLHTGEGNTEESTARVRFIEQKYLARCDYLTASSSGIASAIANLYGVSPPVIIHNVFPWADRLQLDGQRKDRVGDELSLYWYSQTIGLDRGLHDVIRAAGALSGRVQLHFRGWVNSDVRRELEREAAAVGVLGQMHLHDQVPPEELLSRAVEHDVGLALEQGETPNRAICATNKMFLYMLAGLAIVGTDVPGQRAILGQLPDAAKLYAPNDAESLARVLSEWQSDAACLRRAKQKALDAAQSRWNWELESNRLVETVGEALARPPRGVRPNEPLDHSTSHVKRDEEARRAQNHQIA